MIIAVGQERQPTIIYSADRMTLSGTTFEKRNDDLSTNEETGNADVSVRFNDVEEEDPKGLTKDWGDKVKTFDA